MNWTCLKALNEIYVGGRTRHKPTVLADPTVRHLLNATRELVEVGKFLEFREGFKEYYERYHHANFSAYTEFLQRHDLLKPQTRFDESDIRILMDLEVQMANGNLIELRDQIISSNETVRGVSLMFFKHEKYLLGRTALVEAVKKLLQVDALADDRDLQYKYVLECHDPKIIVLCENIAFLKRPTQSRENHIELWYAGGKNIDKLQYADPRGLPIFYLCDWDYDGLLIYGLVKGKIPAIKLLMPNGNSRSIVTTEHNSLWKEADKPEKTAGLDQSLFNQPETKLIHELISSNSWIIEESNDLIAITKPFLT